MDQLKSIVEELDAILPARNKHAIIEGRATHIIASVINLAKLIRENYSEDTADDLIKRLHRSILGEDDRKFMRKIKELRKER